MIIDQYLKLTQLLLTMMDTALNAPNDEREMHQNLLSLMLKITAGTRKDIGIPKDFETATIVMNAIKAEVLTASFVGDMAAVTNLIDAIQVILKALDVDSMPEGRAVLAQLNSSRPAAA